MIAFDTNNRVLNGDQAFMFELFVESSRRFREGRTERVGVVFYFLKTFHRWENDRVKAAYTALVENGAVVVNSKSEIRAFKSPSDPKKSEQNLKRIRLLDGNVRCVYCRRLLTMGIATRDHVIPKSRIQGDLEDNIVWACKTCNQLKANRTPHEWARDILRYNCKVSNPGPSLLQRWLIQARVAIVSWLAWLAS